MDLLRYEVFDRKDRWMGGYSVELNKNHLTSALEMAQINARQSNGKIMAVYSDGSKSRIKF